MDRVFDYKTDCMARFGERESSIPSHPLAYKSGIHSALVGNAGLAAGRIPNDFEGRRLFLEEHSEGYYEIQSIFGGDTQAAKNPWPKLPTGCDGCEFLERCYEKSGQGYVFITKTDKTD